MNVIVMGVTASGKTTVGRRLAERLGWPFFDADQFHPPANIDKMSHGIPLTDADREPWLHALHDLLAKQEREGHDAVLACSALKEHYRQVLREGLRDVLFVYLKGDPAVLQARLDRRKGHFMPRTMLESQLAALEEPNDALTLDASRPPSRLVDRILASIRAAKGKKEAGRQVGR